MIVFFFHQKYTSSYTPLIQYSWLELGKFEDLARDFSLYNCMPQNHFLPPSFSGLKYAKESVKVIS